MSAEAQTAAQQWFDTRRRHNAWRLAMALAALAVAGAVAILVGPIPMSPHAVMTWLLDQVPLVDVASDLSAQDAVILSQIRLPRVVLGGLVGATLATSGAAYQAVFRNPLADPYLLGAAAGAGLGVTIVLVAGSAAVAAPIAPFAAFGGALAGVALAYVLGTSRQGGRTSTSLVLAGVAVASFLTAGQAYVQQRNVDTVRQVYTWILGRLGTAGWAEVTLVLPYALLALGALVACRRALDVIALGDEEAASLGMNVKVLRLIIVLAASLGTAAAVAAGGLIGFVGIIVPHTVRIVAGGSYRVVVAMSLIFGAAFLILADLLARTVIAPAELPIGVVTAFVGAPFFAIVLRQSTGTRRG